MQNKIESFSGIYFMHRMYEQNTLPSNGSIIMRFPGQVKFLSFFQSVPSADILGFLFTSKVCSPYLTPSPLLICLILRLNLFQGPQSCFTNYILTQTYTLSIPPESTSPGKSEVRFYFSVTFCFFVRLQALKKLRFAVLKNTDRTAGHCFSCFPFTGELKCLDVELSLIHNVCETDS